MVGKKKKERGKQVEDDLVKTPWSLEVCVSTLHSLTWLCRITWGVDHLKGTFRGTADVSIGMYERVSGRASDRCSEIRKDEIAFLLRSVLVSVCPIILPVSPVRLATAVIRLDDDMDGSGRWRHIGTVCSVRPRSDFHNKITIALLSLCGVWSQYTRSNMPSY